MGPKSRGPFACTELGALYKVGDIGTVLARTFHIGSEPHFFTSAPGLPFPPDPTQAAIASAQVLIVVPFREAALRVVQLFISLLEGDSKKKIIVSNKKRFQSEYGSDPEERPPNLKRPEDYEAVFVGNIDDHFRIGNSSLSELGCVGSTVCLEPGIWKTAFPKELLRLPPLCQGRILHRLCFWSL